MLEPICRKPNRVRQTDKDLIVRCNEWERGKQRVTQSGGILLYRVADRRVPDLTPKIIENVSLGWRNNKADACCGRVDHSLNQVFTYRARTVAPIFSAGTHRKQFFGKRQRLDSRAQSSCRHNAPDSVHAAPSSNSTSSVARCSAVCSANTRSRAAVAISLRFCWSNASASLTSDAPEATRISRPGSKKCSSPSQSSLITGVPQAAASNNRPDGQ